MKLAAILDLAATVQQHGPNASLAAAELAAAVLELLGEAAPCGFEAPVVRRGSVEIPASWVGEVEPDDARALARMLLRGADEAVR